MRPTSDVEAVVAPPPDPPGRTGTFAGRTPAELVVDAVRHVLLLGWLGLLLATVLVGEKQESWEAAKEAVASGDVRTVSVSDELSDASGGSRTVWVRWREHGVRRIAEVVQLHPAGAAAPGDTGETVDDGREGIASAPSEVLTRLDPDLVVEPGRSPSLQGTVLDWQVPGTVAVAALVLNLAVLGLIIGGPQPWRATRWAWFWLFASPVGGIAYTVLAGPTLGVPRPRRIERRLTGGWAFLLAALVGGPLGTSD